MSESSEPLVAALRVEIHDLEADNQKLRSALSGLIACTGGYLDGVPPEGPAWATPEAKARNRASCERAIEDACACFPSGYNGFLERLSSN